MEYLGFEPGLSDSRVLAVKYLIVAALQSIILSSYDHSKAGQCVLSRKALTMSVVVQEPALVFKMPQAKNKVPNTRLSSGQGSDRPGKDS